MLEYACTAFADAELTVLFVLDPFGYYEERDGFPDRLDDWYANLERRADRPFEEAAERGVEIDTATEQGRPDRAIVAHAVQNDFDGVVLGAHGRRDLAGRPPGERSKIAYAIFEPIRTLRVPMTSPRR